MKKKGKVDHYELRFDRDPQIDVMVPAGVNRLQLVVMLVDGSSEEMVAFSGKESVSRFYDDDKIMIDIYSKWKLDSNNDVIPLEGWPVPQAEKYRLQALRARISRGSELSCAVVRILFTVAGLVLAFWWWSARGVSRVALGEEFHKVLPVSRGALGYVTWLALSLFCVVPCSCVLCCCAFTDRSSRHVMLEVCRSLQQFVSDLLQQVKDTLRKKDTKSESGVAMCKGCTCEAIASCLTEVLNDLRKDQNMDRWKGEWLMLARLLGIEA